MWSYGEDGARTPGAAGLCTWGRGCGVLLGTPGAWCCIGCVGQVLWVCVGTRDNFMRLLYYAKLCSDYICKHMKSSISILSEIARSQSHAAFSRANLSRIFAPLDNVFQLSQDVLHHGMCPLSKTWWLPSRHTERKYQCFQCAIQRSHSQPGM